jgi:hypothetical protein
VSALDGLLLSVDQINTAMGARGMTGAQIYSGTMSDITPQISDKNCVVSYDAQRPVYTGSGWTTLREQQVQQPVSPDKRTEYADQVVVLFPTAAGAAAFFTASATKWQSCANRQFTYTGTSQDDPSATWTVGTVSNTNGTLSVRRTQEGLNNWNCQHALTVRNNVAVDVDACSYNQGDFAINIAQQIAAKVPNQ